MNKYQEALENIVWEIRISRRNPKNIEDIKVNLDLLQELIARFEEVKNYCDFQEYIWNDQYELYGMEGDNTKATVFRSVLNVLNGKEAIDLQ